MYLLMDILLLQKEAQSKLLQKLISKPHVIKMHKVFFDEDQLTTRSLFKAKTMKSSIESCSPDKAMANTRGKFDIIH